MTILKRLLLCSWMLLFYLPCTSQIDTSITVTEIEVTAFRLPAKGIGGINQQWRQSAIEKLPVHSIGDLLAAGSGVFIKSYGLGSLATSSIRGGRSEHTLVLWNGLPIQSPMLGLLDLSLLPASGTEEVSLQKSGNGALWGSGAIGGLIGMNSRANFENRLVIKNQTSIGSFGDWKHQLVLGFGNKKFQSKTKFLDHRADNDFKYSIGSGLPKRQQSNASLSRQHILQDFYWKPAINQQVAVHFWQQFSDIEIPPTFVQRNSTAYQEDRATRVIADWKYFRNTVRINAKTGFFREHLDYFDELSGIESLSHFQTLMGELTLQAQWKRLEYFIGLTHFNTRAFIDVYQNDPIENRTALFGSIKWQMGNMLFQSSIRQEVVDNSFVPVIPDFAVNIPLSKQWLWQMKASRNFRIPTFNHRYWRPGGDENLLPESGWSFESTISYEQTFKTGQINTSLAIYNRNIENQLDWSPRDNTFIFYASNIGRVWSRGVEVRTGGTFTMKPIIFNVQLGYDHVRSTNEIAYSGYDIGEQLWYTPRHQGFAFIGLQWADFHLSYQHSYTGASVGVNENIDSYFVAHLRMQYDWRIKKHPTQIFFNVYNLWNADYFVIDRRPMPGVHGALGIKVTLHSDKDVRERH